MALLATAASMLVTGPLGPCVPSIEFTFDVGAGVHGDIAVALIGRDVEVAGSVAIRHRPKIGATRDRWAGPSHRAIGKGRFAFGVDLDVAARIVIDRLTGLRVDTLSPGHILDVLGSLEELPVQAVETIGEAVAIVVVACFAARLAGSGAETIKLGLRRTVSAARAVRRSR
jgi:hypothetical protein